MKDKELLELAAKAAGYKICSVQNGKLNCYGLDGKYNFHWNPLTDDGDALRLAVKLGMCVLCHATQVEYSKGNGQVGMIAEQTFRDEAAAQSSAPQQKSVNL